MRNSTATQSDLAPARSAMDEFLALHRTGELAARFPELAGLLRRIPGEHLPQCGRLLARVDPDDILRAHPDLTAVSVAITGHGTVAPVVPPLTAELARHGIVLRPYVGDFDGYVFELSDPGSEVYSRGADLVLCLLDPGVVFDELPVPWRPEDVERIFAAKVDLLDGLAAEAEKHSSATLVFNTMPLHPRWTAQLVDRRSRASLSAVWRECTSRLLRLTEWHPRLVVSDIEVFLTGSAQAHDARLSAYTRTHLHPELLAAYARDVGYLVRGLTAGAKKCLAVDLDGTVWGGILGDDGIDGIEVADGPRGEAFGAFQRVLKQIASQGVLLAAVSKNDSEPVHQVLREHPDMSLRESDFAGVCADWRPKPESLRWLADSLNLGLDSFVFVDDSAFECGLVRRETPEVSVVQVGEEPALHVETLLADGWFDVLEITDEDRARTTRYRDEVARRSFLGAFDSLADYLRELRIAVRIAAPSERDIARVSQLSLRTNQFNLTTWRLDPSDVRELLVDPEAAVLAIRSEDRFGDNGLVGAVFVRRVDRVLHIENFILSCRVFSRGIENACMSTLLRQARTAGFDAVTGVYRRSPKNHKVEDFYRRCGFSEVPDPTGTARGTLFRNNLLHTVDPPDHIALDPLPEGSIPANLPETTSRPRPGALRTSVSGKVPDVPIAAPPSPSSGALTTSVPDEAATPREDSCEHD